MEETDPPVPSPFLPVPLSPFPSASTTACQGSGVVWWWCVCK